MKDARVEAERIGNLIIDQRHADVLEREILRIQAEALRWAADQFADKHNRVCYDVNAKILELEERLK